MIQLVNYCHERCRPFFSITRLSEAEAYEMAGQLARHEGETAFGRFADFHNYYPARMRTEKWLHESFVRLGGTPQTGHPLYFVVQGSDFLHGWFGRGTVTALSLDAVGAEHISFTLGDSMAMMDRPERQDVFTKAELLARIARAGGDADAYVRSVCGQYRYIEAQLWSDAYVEGDKDATARA